MTEHLVSTEVHGRFLHEKRDSGRLLVGFHGYAELAESSMEELQRIPGEEAWSLVAVQALHTFYTRSGQVVACWMTSQHRERAIASNVAFVKSVLAALPPYQKLVFAGFSQGAAMAIRAAAWSARADGLILLGGDIPPEIRSDESLHLPPVLLGRGSRDEWYTEEKFKQDLSFLEARTRVTRCMYAGGHEWTDAFRAAAGEFLREIAG
jgi:predicted esterase